MYVHNISLIQTHQIQEDVMELQERNEVAEGIESLAENEKTDDIKLERPDVDESKQNENNQGKEDNSHDEINDKAVVPFEVGHLSIDPEEHFDVEALEFPVLPSQQESELHNLNVGVTNNDTGVEQENVLGTRTIDGEIIFDLSKSIKNIF